MTFGQKLQRERTVKGWTQQYVADQVSVDQTTVSDWELDKQKPTDEHLQMLQKIFPSL